MFKIYDGRIEFYQWDLDRKIIVSDPAIDEVHFCNKTDNCSLVCKVYEENNLRVVNVPNILLQDNWDIRVYGYCGECYTKQAARFKVVGRTKPSDYVYTETEVRSWEAIEKRCDEVLDIAEGLARGATSGMSFFDYESLINDLNAADNKKYFSPQHMLIKTLGVPDVWVYEIKEESVPYEYVDDATFAQAVTESLVQVGYYVLSALETQKVDLTDYAEKSFVDENYLKKFKRKNTQAGAWYVYVQNHLGVDQMLKLSNTSSNPDSTVPFRDVSGRIAGVGAPQNDDDAVNKGYADENYVKILTGSGNVLYARLGGETRGITYAYSPVANTMAYRDSNGNFQVNAPVAEKDCVPNDYLQENYVQQYKTGGATRIYGVNRQGAQVQLLCADIASAIQTQRVAMYVSDAGTDIEKEPNGALVTKTPVKTYQCANKKYVDELIASLQAQIDELKGV